MPRRMTRAEIKRFAHKRVADLIGQYIDTAPSLLLDDEGVKIEAALQALAEQHRRYGPKSTDMTPLRAVPRTTPLLDQLEARP